MVYNVMYDPFFKEGACAFMLSRASIKERAKAAFGGQYWLFVGLFAIIAIVTRCSAGFGSDASSVSDALTDCVNAVCSTGSGLFSFGILFVLSLGLSALGLAFCIFAANPVTVSGARISLDAYDGEEVRFGDILFGFKPGRYWRVVGAMALYTLFTALATACFIVPGVIVGLGLSQVPYILAEEDDITVGEALGKSWDMMGGHKWELFVFELSFIGWILLSAVTCGAVGVFYAFPYMRIAHGGYHRELVASRRFYRTCEDGSIDVDDIIGD